MGSPSTPTLVDFTPPPGTRFTIERELPLEAVSRDLCKIVAFLQGLTPFGKLVRYDDWYDHDGLYFERGRTDFHGLFQVVQTPRALLDGTPDDDHVYAGIAPEDRGWYLRFRAERDDHGEGLMGTFSLLVGGQLVERFEGEIIPDLECPVRRAAEIGGTPAQTG
jgi:hypothetical protein